MLFLELFEQRVQLCRQGTHRQRLFSLVIRNSKTTAHIYHLQPNTQLLLQPFGKLQNVTCVLHNRFHVKHTGSHVYMQTDNIHM
ncbi:hypothetical protein D3C76_1205220 [compost metagenome]